MNHLRTRVRHLLGFSPASELTRWWPAGVCLLAVPLVLWGATSGLMSTSRASAQEERAEKKEGDRDKEERKDGERRDGERKDEPRRDVDRVRDRDVPAREGGTREDALFRLIAQLREEVAQLRNEVRELRARSGGRDEPRRDVDRPRDGERNVEPRRDVDRPRDGVPRREADRPRDGERREEPRKDGDRPRDGEPRREADRPRDGERREEPRKDGDRPRDGERRDGAAPKINGIIRAVEGKLVEISVGSGDGVRIGQQLAVLRGDKVVGRLIIVKVEEDRTVGDARGAEDRDLRPETGDRVILNQK